MNKLKTIGLATGLALCSAGIFSAMHIGKYPDKLWLHRCNSVEKYAEMQEHYRNIEIDVVFRDEGYFDVTHDTDTTFGLCLGTLMSAVAENTRWGGVKYGWISRIYPRITPPGC